MQNYDGQFKLNGQEYFYRAKDDSGSSKITRVNNEEHHYRMVEITNKETGNYDVMMISTGDSFTMFALTIAKVCGVAVEEVFYLQEEEDNG